MVNKSDIFQKLIIAAFLLIGSTALYAQESETSPLPVVERLVILSDRDIYVAGETLLYSVVQVRTLPMLTGAKRTVGYVELLRKGNEPVSREIVKIENRTTPLSILIPDTLSSGNYLLRVYTSHMKNQHPDTYGYRNIFVVNPKNAPNKSSFSKSGFNVADSNKVDIDLIEKDTLAESLAIPELFIMESGDDLIAKLVFEGSDISRSSFFLTVSSDGLSLPSDRLVQGFVDSVIYKRLNQNSGGLLFVLTDNRGDTLRMVPYAAGSSNNISIKIDLDTNTLKNRASINSTIEIKDGKGNPLGGELSVSVVKDVLLVNADQTSESFHSGINDPSLFSDILSSEGGLSSLLSANIPLDNNRSISNYFLPEIEGHIISGRILQGETFQPLADVPVMLSIRGKTAKCYFSVSNKEGGFNFIVSEYGTREVVIMPVDSRITNYYVELSDPFTDRFSKWDAGQIYIDSTRLDEMNSAIIAAQVTKIYGHDHLQEDRVNDNSTGLSFYGEPEELIRPSDYIDLVSVQEVIKEIIPSMFVVKDEGKANFRMYNKYKGYPIHSNPLILVDGIPLREISELLTLEPKIIDRIEVSSVTYYNGSVSINGIGSFFSNDGKLTIDESKGPAFRRLYSFYEPEVKYTPPTYTTDESFRDNEPDFRNTLYWNPSVEIEKGGRAAINFYTGDDPGVYSIVVQFVTDGGAVKREVFRFSVGGDKITE